MHLDIQYCILAIVDPQQVIPRQTDVLIVGGGLIGMCVAYFLKERSVEAIDVTLVERDPTYKQASSALAVGGIRQQFSSPENVLMSLYGAEFLRNVRDWLHVPSLPQPDVQYTPRGYLFLASERGAAQLGSPSLLLLALHCAYCYCYVCPTG